MYISQSEMIKKQHENREALLASKLLAKAILRLPDNKIRVVAVYELSTNYEFYFTYQTKTTNKRAPKKDWGKPRGSYARTYATHDKSPIGFEAFVRHYASIEKAEVLFMRVYSKRTLATVFASPHHQSISSDWQNVQVTPTVHNTRILHLRLDRKIKGRVIDPSWNK